MNIVATGRHLTLVDDDGWEYVKRNHGKHVVIIIPVTVDNRIVFISQFRKPIQRTSLEFPAGLVGDVREGESILDAAKAELLEETGLVSECWDELSSGPVSPGLTDETATIFLATQCEKVGDGGGDESEDIEVHFIPAGHVEIFVPYSEREGLAIDAKVYGGLYFLKAEEII